MMNMEYWQLVVVAGFVSTAGTISAAGAAYYFVCKPFPHGSLEQIARIFGGEFVGKFGICGTAASYGRSILFLPREPYLRVWALRESDRENIPSQYKGYRVRIGIVAQCASFAGKVQRYLRR